MSSCKDSCHELLKMVDQFFHHGSGVKSFCCNIHTRLVTQESYPSTTAIFNSAICKYRSIKKDPTDPWGIDPGIFISARIGDGVTDFLHYVMQ